MIKFTADIDVSSVGVHGSTSDKTALNEFVRVTAHDFAVLASSRLALVSVDDEIPRPNTKINLSRIYLTHVMGLLTEDLAANLVYS